MGFSMVPVFFLFFSLSIPQLLSTQVITASLTPAGGIKGLHVENVDALHLAENLETLETGGLLEIGGDSAGGGTGAEEVILGLDLCLSRKVYMSVMYVFRRMRFRPSPRTVMERGKAIGSWAELRYSAGGSCGRGGKRRA